MCPPKKAATMRLTSNGSSGGGGRPSSGTGGGGASPSPSPRSQRPFRVGMGWFVLLCALTNVYVVVMFHRAERGNLKAGTAGAPPGMAPPRRKGRGLRAGGRRRGGDDGSSEEGDDRDGGGGRGRGGGRSHEELEGLVKSVVRGQLDERAKSDGELKRRIEELKKQLKEEQTRNGAEKVEELERELQDRDEEVRDLEERFRDADEKLIQQARDVAAQLEEAYEANDELKDRLRGGGVKSQRKDKGPKSWRLKPWPLPEDWERYGFHQIRDHYHCRGHAHDQEKKLPTLDDWMYFRKKYVEVVDPNAAFDDPVPPTEGYSAKDGAPPPYRAGISADGRGRAIFASRPIKKGEVVHDGSKSDILFPTGDAWRRYVFALPRKKACDVIDWTWTQKTEEGGPFRIFAAMNISVLFNGAADDEEVNLRPRSKTSTEFVATRDVEEGEELLFDYAIYETVWDEVGLGGEGRGDGEGDGEEEGA